MGKRVVYLVSTKAGQNRFGATETALYSPFCSLFSSIVNLPQLTDFQALSGSVNWSGERNPEPESLHHTSTNSLISRHLGGGSPPLAGREAVKAGRTPLPTPKFSRTIFTHQYPTPLAISTKTQKIKFSKRGVAWNAVSTKDSFTSTPINTRILKIGISGKNDINTVSTAYSFTSTEQNISQS